jgi:hypothetical protein
MSVMTNALRRKRRANRDSSSTGGELLLTQRMSCNTFHVGTRFRKSLTHCQFYEYSVVSARRFINAAKRRRVAWRAPPPLVE